ncbi:unnamed protein product [Allacma fusca]|uniref:Cytochrome P450 n=1 Tax=Allacma fusca TaxID=39272 RepID=A0A8J2K4H4_9HEXA|nr:unnamed protein product [Allacma fusca]
MIILEMLSITLTATILIISAAILFLRKKTTKCLHSIPGPRVFPIVGNALQLADKTKFLNRLLQWHHQFGDRYLFSIGPTNTLVLADLKDLKTVLESQSLLSKGHAYYFTRSWLGNGLLVSKGNKWRIRRKILTPAFHFKILELFQSVSNEQSMILVKLMKRKHEKCEPCLIHNMISLCALGIICDAALGTRLRCQEESSVYTQAVMKQSEYIFNRLISPWFHNNYIWSRWGHGEAEKKNLAILNDFIHQIIVERKTMYKKSKKNLDIGGNEPLTAERLAFLDLLIEIQSKTETSLTDDDIYEETATFTFEGHDTTAAGLTWTLYLLSKHPEYQESVHDELKTIFARFPVR